MGHIVRETDWCTIDLDTGVGRIFFQQRWLYVWLTAPGQAAWTLAEKHEFHTRSDRAIWAIWSNRTTLTVSGTSPVAFRFARTGMPINLDVRWVLSGAHWTVRVMKVAAGAFFQSQVLWPARQIELGSRDFEAVDFTGSYDSPAPRRQVTVAHEFGHAAGNTGVLNRGDEYRRTSPHYRDPSSIMHTGSALRDRHFRTILEEANKMLPDTRFAFAATR